MLHAFETLEKREGFRVTRLPVDRGGRIDLQQLADALTPETTLVSLMSANNETGTRQPIAEASRLCRERGVLFHSDAIQTFGKEAIDARDYDALSLAAHKFYGPKGAGLLYLRAGISIERLQVGGSHEGERRAGTENAAAIAGMAAAAEYAVVDMATEQQREAVLRDRLWAGVRAAFPAAVRNGAPEAALANTLNVTFPGLEGESLLMNLDLEGVCASSGSACMVGSVLPSHVLLAMGVAARAREIDRPVLARPWNDGGGNRGNHRRGRPHGRADATRRPRLMQLDFFRRLWGPPKPPPPAPAPAAEALPAPSVAPEPPPRKVSAIPLQERAKALLIALGHATLAERLTVRWNTRMRSTAGMAYPGQARVTLNPRLIAFGDAEIDRTLLHEVAHLLAHERAGRRRIAPHGPEWRRACQDLGLVKETRCHTLPLPRRKVARPHRYRCPACGTHLDRVRPLRKKAACLACCKQHNGGKFDERFSLVKVRAK